MNPASCVLDRVPAYQQRGANWCWAACTQMVLDWWARRPLLTQDQIVDFRYPSPPRDRTSWPPLVKAGLTHFSTACKPLLPIQLDQELCVGLRPIVMQVDTHIVVGIGMGSGRWAIRTIDPINRPGAWTRMAWDGYARFMEYTYHQLGAANQAARDEDPLAVCAGTEPGDEKVSTLTADQLRGDALRAEIEGVVQLFGADRGAPSRLADEELEPLRVFRPRATGGPIYFKLFKPFTLTSGENGFLAYRRLDETSWVRFSAAVSDFATLLIRVAEQRRRAGRSVDLLELGQGEYAWVEVDADGRQRGPSERFDLAEV